MEKYEYKVIKRPYHQVNSDSKIEKTIESEGLSDWELVQKSRNEYPSSPTRQGEVILILKRKIMP